MCLGSIPSTRKKNINLSSKKEPSKIVYGTKKCCLILSQILKIWRSQREKETFFHFYVLILLTRTLSGRYYYTLVADCTFQRRSPTIPTSNQMLFLQCTLIFFYWEMNVSSSLNCVVLHQPRSRKRSQSDLWTSQVGTTGWGAGLVSSGRVPWHLSQAVSARPALSPRDTSSQKAVWTTRPGDWAFSRWFQLPPSSLPARAQKVWDRTSHPLAGRPPTVTMGW